MSDHPLEQTDEQREAQLEKLRLLQLQNDDDLRLIMSHESGRRWMYRQIDRAGMFRSSFVESRQGTDFREGMRNIALMLWSDLQRACPGELLRMQKENQAS